MMLTLTKQDHMSDVQHQVERAIHQLVESGAELGIQVAVYQAGEQVVEAAAGVADPATGRSVTSDTPFYNFSIVKGAASTIAHVLAERGLFGYDTPVAALWPEFRFHGKGSATVRHVLNHSAGVPLGAGNPNRVRRCQRFRVRGHCNRDRVHSDQEPADPGLLSGGSDQPDRQRGGLKT